MAAPKALCKKEFSPKGSNCSILQPSLLLSARKKPWLFSLHTVYTWGLYYPVAKGIYMFLLYKPLWGSHHEPTSISWDVVTKKSRFSYGSNKSLHVSNHRSDGVTGAFQISLGLLQQRNSRSVEPWDSVVSPAIFHTFAWSLGMAGRFKKGDKIRDLSWWSLVSCRWVQATNLVKHLAESWITQSCLKNNPLQIRTFTAIQPKESSGNLQHEKNTCGSFH